MELQIRVSRLERLLALTKRIVAEADVNRMLELLLEGIVGFTDADQGFLLLREPDGKPRVRAAINLDRATVRSERFRPYRRIADYVLGQGEPFLSAEVGADSRLAPTESVHEVPKSVMAVPLRSSEAVVGAVYADKLHEGAGAFRVEDLRLLQDFGDVAVTAVENRMRFNRLERQGEELQRATALLEQMTTSLQEDVAAKSVELAQFERDLDSKNRALGLKYTFNNIVGRSREMQRIFDVLNQVMDYPVPVLITGESGTGKELIARALHHGGPRGQLAFMAINCAAIPENLLESELFGYKKGAFTGAVTDKEGLFRAARGGTVFLDEIGEMPLSLQAKLLRVLQEKEVRPIGGRDSEPVEARIVAATNRHLQDLVRQGSFREDLYYRLNVVEITVPSLRERVEDIPILAEHFLVRFADEFGIPRKRLSASAMQRLMQAEWQGNVRQLENAIKSSAILCRADVISAAELRLPPPSAAAAAVEVVVSAPVEPPRSPAPAPAPPQPSDSGLHGIRNRAEWEAHEKQRILDALVRCSWNKTRAATALGVSRRNLYRKLTRYGIEGVE